MKTKHILFIIIFIIILLFSIIYFYNFKYGLGNLNFITITEGPKFFTKDSNGILYTPVYEQNDGKYKINLIKDDSITDANRYIIQKDEVINLQISNVHIDINDLEFEIKAMINNTYDYEYIKFNINNVKGVETTQQYTIKNDIYGIESITLLGHEPYDFKYLLYFNKNNNKVELQQNLKQQFQNDFIKT